MPNVREALVAMLRPYAGTTSTQQTRSTTGDALDVPTVYEVLSKPVPTGPSN